MRYGQITLEKEQSARLLGWGIRFFLTAALTASRTPGGYAPFALGCIAAAGPGADGGAALLGGLVGAVLFVDFADALPFLAAGILILTAATAFQGTRFLSGRRVMALTAAVLFLVVSGIYVLQSLSPWDRLTPCLAAAGLTGAAAWFFIPLFQPREAHPDAEGILFLTAALLLALFLVVRHFGMAGQGTAKTTVRAAEPAETIENITLIDFIRDNKVFTLMQLGIAAIYFQNSVLNNFMLQIVESVGGTSEDMGRVLAVMAFLEIPALFFFDRIRRWFCCQTLLKVAAIGFTVKILLIFVAKDITLIYAAHLLQPFSFALFLPAMVAFTDEIMRRGEAVKGQACYTMMITASSIIASIAGGVLLDTAGAKMMLLVATILTGVGAAMVVLLVGRIRQKNDKPQQTVA